LAPPRRNTTARSALQEKERLYFVEHHHGNARAKANGVTFEAGVPAEHEVYFAINDSTEFRAPAMTLTHMGGVEIEELDKKLIANVPFEALTGLKAFVVANALSDIGAPKEVISPLVQHLPKLWELMHHYGMTTLELNPIRMRQGKDGRLTLSPAISNAASTATIRAGSGSDFPTTCSPPIPPSSSRRSTSCAPIRASRTSSSSTARAQYSRQPSAAGRIRWSPRCSATPR
jgi:succinyl-CoA synthetase beta subunit